MTLEFSRVEFMVGDVRRRRWTADRKLQIIEESFAPGETVSAVTRRHGVAPNLLFRWRRLLTMKVVRWRSLPMNRLSIRPK